MSLWGGWSARKIVGQPLCLSPVRKVPSENPSEKKESRAVRASNVLKTSWIVGACVLALSVAVPVASAATYYVSQSTGDDAANGLAPQAKGQAGPWKTLAKASMAYEPGDQLLLKCGDTWDEELCPQGEGTPDKPILISSYGTGNKPIIDRQDFTKDNTGIRLTDQGGFKFVGLEFNRCMTGIYGEYSAGCPTKKFIWIEDCYFHDSLLYQHYEDYPKRKIGLGVCFFSFELANKIVLTDITVKNCVFRRLASGFWTNSPDNFNKNTSFIYNFGNLNFEDCLFEEGYQWQLGIRGVDGGSVKNCVTHDIGRGFLSFNGVAGGMFFRCKDWLFVDSEWGFVDIGQGSGDGEAFDFEGNCDNMTMRNCNFHDTDGPGFLLCCYASDGNPNKGIVMENCIINAKSKRPIRPRVRASIINTTDWTESAWKDCRFYLSPGEGIMAVMDPEKDKRSAFTDCFIKDLSQSCGGTKAPAKQSNSSKAAVEKAKAAGDASAENPWLQIEFSKPTKINEFKLKEDPASSISRYRIECWDDKKSAWVGCFNGRNIGAEFVAPIVECTTKKARLLILQTDSGDPSILAFEAYADTLGDAFTVPRGQSTPPRVGK